MLPLLIALKRKGVTWEWSTAKQMAFDVLKEALQSNSVLTYPQTNKSYKLCTDACDYAVGDVLIHVGWF